MGKDLPAWWYQALKNDKRGFWEKSLGESLEAPSTAEIRRNQSRGERRSRFAAAVAEHEAHRRMTQITATPPAPNSLPPAKLTDRMKLRRAYARDATKGIRFWRRAARQAARAESAVFAERDADVADEKARAERTAAQAELDRALAPLLDHEHDAVLDSLVDFFRDLPHEVLHVGPTDDGAIVFIAVDEDDVPSVEPDLTPTGKLTARRLKERASGTGSTARR